MHLPVCPAYGWASKANRGCSVPRVCWKPGAADVGFSGPLAKVQPGDPCMGSAERITITTGKKGAVLRAAHKSSSSGLGTPKEQHQWLHEGRDWASVQAFWKAVVAGNHSLQDMWPPLQGVIPAGDNLAEDASASQQPRSRQSRGGAERITYKVVLQYFGPAFIGWSWQPNSCYTVEGTLQGALQALAGADSPRVIISSAGRTDRGVSACGQVASFYARTPQPLTASEVGAAIHAASPVAGALRVLSVQQMPRSWHPMFAAQWRRYVYLFPLRSPQWGSSRAENVFWLDADSDANATDVHALLQPLVGKDLDYWSFGRDTPAGKDCVCRLLLARAHTVALPHQVSMSAQQPCRALCVELVGNRFIRRMVRVLVSTACLQARRKTAVKPAMLENSSPTTGVALQQSMDSPEKLALETDALLSICVARDRLLTGVPAPAEGLCLAEVGYEGYLAPR